jgi:hypothetical protein
MLYAESLGYGIYSSISRRVPVFNLRGYITESRIVVPCSMSHSIFLLLLCCVGVHCDIYKSSYNISTISYLNLPPPSFFIPSSPHSWNSFSRSHFSIYIQVYTVFALYSPSHTLSLSLPPLTGTKPPGRTCSTILFSSFVKENK